MRIPDGVPLGDRRLPARSSLSSALPSVPSYECATRYLHRATLSAAVRAMKTLMNLPPLRSMLRPGIHSTVIFASMYILLRACSGHASLWLIRSAEPSGPQSSDQRVLVKISVAVVRGAREGLHRLCHNGPLRRERWRVGAFALGLTEPGRLPGRFREGAVVTRVLGGSLRGGRTSGALLSVST